MKNWLVLDVCDEERQIRISPNPEMDCACISMSSKGTDQVLEEMEEELTGYEFIDEYLLDGIIGEGDLDKLKDKNYVVILSTDDNEVCIHTFDTVDQVRTYIQTYYSRPDDSGWFIDRVYDLKDEKELKYNVEVVGTIYN